MKNVIKASLGIIATVTLFLLLKNALGNPSSVSQSIKNAYPPSFLARMNLTGLGYFGLIVAVLLHYLVNARWIERSRDSRPCFAFFTSRGLSAYQVLCFFYGVIWFAAFLECGFVFYGRMEARCILSGTRDLLTLTAAGFIFSALFSDRNPKGPLTATAREANARRGNGELFVIPCVAAGFFALHLLQYRFTLASAEKHVWTIGSISWLALFGILIGSVYYLFAGRARRPFFFAADFFLNIFGCNWFLYNLFYNPALAIPVWEILVRSGTGIAGGFLGASAYYLARRAVS